MPAKIFELSFIEGKPNTWIKWDHHPFTLQGFPLGHHLCHPPVLQQQALSHATSIKIFNIQYNTNPEVGFGTFLWANTAWGKAQWDQKDAWEASAAWDPGPFLSPTSIQVSSSSLAIRSQPRWLFWGSSGESRAERTSSGSQKPSQSAKGRLYSCLHYKSVWSLLLVLLLLGMLFPSSTRKISTIAFGLGNASKEIFFQKEKEKKKKTKHLWFWEACSEVHTVILSHQSGTCTLRENRTPGCSVYRSHIHHTSMGKLDCSTTQDRHIPKTPISNPLKTPSLSDQYGFLAQRFSLLPPAPQQAQGPVWLHFSGVALPFVLR